MGYSLVRHKHKKVVAEDEWGYRLFQLSGEPKRAVTGSGQPAHCGPGAIGHETGLKKAD
jgi:hypothetical protein